MIFKKWEEIMPWEKIFNPSIQYFYCFIQSFLFYFMKYNIVTYTEEKSVKKEIISNGNHKYHYRPKLDIKKSCYQLIIKITISEERINKL